MKLSKRMLFGVIACALALLLVVVGIPLINTASDPQTRIVRAIGDIEKGTTITADKLAYVDVSATGLPSAVIKDAADIVGKYALVDIVAGDYILPAKIGSYKPVDTSIYATLEDGLIAITINAPSFAATLAGNIQIGDIVSFYSVGDHATVFELQYVRIAELLTGDGTSVEDVQVSETGEEENTAISAITFVVTEQQATALMRLSYNGTVHFELVCRNDADRAEMLLAKQQAMLERLEEARAEIHDSYLRLFDETYEPDDQTLSLWYRQNIGGIDSDTLWLEVMENYDNQAEDPDERLETDRIYFQTLIDRRLAEFDYNNLVDWQEWEEEWDMEWEASHTPVVPVLPDAGTETEAVTGAEAAEDEKQ